MVMMRTLRAQAAEALRGLIETRYSPGERLPPEPELAKQMGLSRNTVREAIAELVNEGRLDRKWGVGTTVLLPRAPAAFSVTDVGPIRRIIESSGHTPGLARFRNEVVTAPAEVIGALGIPDDAAVMFIERLFAIDGVPAVLLYDWCRTHIDDVALDVSALSDITVDLPTLIREQSGRILDRLEGKIDAIPPSTDFIDAGRTDRPLVQITQTVFTRENQPVLYSTIQFDTSAVDLTIRRTFAFA